MFEIIKVDKKILKNNVIFKTLNVTFKLEIEIIINNVKLIFNVYEFNIFKDSKNMLSIFLRLLTIINIL